MNKYVLWIAVAVLFGAFSAGSARADVTGTDDFTITDIVGGAYAGDTFTGSFSFDATAAATGFTPLLSFATNLPSWVGGTLADAVSPTYSDVGGLDFFYAPAPVGNTDAFAFFGGNIFTYGTTEEVNGEFGDAGQGAFTVTPAVAATPEPGSLALLSIGLLGLLGFGLVRRKTLPLASSRLA